MSNHEDPHDRFHLVWILFFLLGVGALLPWDFFMTASAYFTERLNTLESVSNTSSNGTQQRQGADTSLEKRYDGTMTLVSMMAIFITSLGTTMAQSLVSAKVRILVGLVGVLAMFVLTAAIVWVQTLSANSFFNITMASVFVINVFGTIFEASLFGLMGQFPTTYTTAVMSGVGIAGMVTALALILAHLGISNNSSVAFAYFVTASVMTLITIGCYLALTRLKFATHYLTTETEVQLTENVSYTESCETKDEKTQIIQDGIPNKQASNIRASIVRIYGVFKKIWMPALSVCGIFWLTFAVFPAVTVRVKTTADENSRWATFFQPVCGFLLYGFSDSVGRSLPGFYMWPKQGSCWLPLLVVMRLAFVPAFLLCNITPRPLGVAPFRHDAAFSLFMILMGVSHGCLTTLAMSYGPKQVNASQAESAGVIMMAFTSLGLAFGGISSFCISSHL